MGRRIQPSMARGITKVETGLLARDELPRSGKIHVIAHVVYYLKKVRFWAVMVLKVTTDQGYHLRLMTGLIRFLLPVSKSELFSDNDCQIVEYPFGATS